MTLWGFGADHVKTFSFVLTRPLTLSKTLGVLASMLSSLNK